jgi:restriction system protein
MELPKFNETFLPILEVLRDGETIKGRDLVRIVEEKFYSDLPQELLDQTTKSGDRLIENRIAGGKSYLKKGGLVHYPQRGYVQITEKGKSAKPENVSLDEIQSNVISFYEPENQTTPKTKIESNASPQDLIDSGFEHIEREVKDELLSKLKEVDPYVFEKIILILLKKNGLRRFH